MQRNGLSLSLSVCLSRSLSPPLSLSLSVFFSSSFYFSLTLCTLTALCLCLYTLRVISPRVASALSKQRAGSTMDESTRCPLGSVHVMHSGIKERYLSRTHSLSLFPSVCLSRSISLCLCARGCMCVSLSPSLPPHLCFCVSLCLYWSNQPDVPWVQCTS